MPNGVRPKLSGTFFKSLLSFFEITPSKVGPFELDSVVQPVALTFSGVTLEAESVPVEDKNQNIVQNTGPVSGTVLNDTGQLATGTYWFKIICAMQAGTAQRTIVVQHRDAPNTGSVWVFGFDLPSAGGIGFQTDWVQTVAQNERVRVATGQNFGGGETYNGWLAWKKLV